MLLLIERRGRGFPGRTFWLFVLLYSISRFVIEFYRGDDRGMPLAWLSTSQLISVVLAPLSHRHAVVSEPAVAAAGRRNAGAAAEAALRDERPRFAIADCSRDLIRVHAGRNALSAHRLSSSSSGARRAAARSRPDRTRLPGYSRSQVQRLIEDGHVALPRVKTVKSNTAVREGDVIVTVELPEPVAAQRRPPRTFRLDVLYQDADVVVVNKPAGMVVHPARDTTAARSSTRCCTTSPT